MEIEITLKIDLPDNFINIKDKIERDWLFESILKNAKQLMLHSNEIGDEIGTIKEVKNVKTILPLKTDKMKAEKQLTAKEIAKLFVWKTETYKYDLRDCESMIEEYTNSKLKIIIETIENQKEKIAHCESDEEVWNDGLDRAIEIIKKEITKKN